VRLLRAVAEAKYTSNEESVIWKQYIASFVPHPNFGLALAQIRERAGFK
jgi:hypothetical protein